MVDTLAKVYLTQGGLTVRRGRPSLTIPAPPVGGSEGTVTGRYVVGQPFVMDTTKPSADNTGPAAGGYSPVVAINGDVTLAAGQVLENRVINGYVTMGSGSILRGCIVQGRNYGLTISSYAHGGSFLSVPAGLSSSPTVEFCDVGAVAPIHYAMNTLRFDGPCYFRRNNLHDGTDFIKASGNQVDGDIAGNWFHHYSYHDDDNDQSGSTPPYVSHNDGTQIQAGNNGYTYHCTLVDMHPSQVSSVGQPASNVSVGWGCPITIAGAGASQNLNVHHNWFSGGNAGVFQANSMPSEQGSTSVGYIGQNRVALDQYNYGGGSRYQIRYALAYSEILGQTTNSFDPDDPAAIAAGVAGQTFVVGTTGTSGIRRP